MNQEEQDYYDQMQTEQQQMLEGIGETPQFSNANNSVYSGIHEDNIIKWQLDFSEDLDRIYHLLKGSQIEIDSNGNVNYVEPKHDKDKPFNEHGVQLIMNVVSFYLNRNTILSNYDEKVINWKVLDFGHELSDLIFNKYQEMGMDDKEKQKLYPMIVREIVDTVHSAYLRAFNGGERTSLRKTMHVSQMDGMNQQQSYAMPQQVNQKKAKWYNPTTWA